MKRCPQCLFIYPESDERCDFDQTPLVIVDDSEIDGAPKPRRRNKLLLIVVWVVIAASSFAGYRVFISDAKEEQASTAIPVAPTPTAPELPTPSTSPSVSPSPSPSPSPKPSPTRVATSHTTTNLGPVSTSGSTRGGGKPVIILTTGGKIDADEVWRTRDGVWYRKNGIVTLLKAGRVKAIINR